MAVRQQHLRALAPYLEGSGPNSEGEWGMHCPLHEDVTRSSSLNVESSEYWCFVCGEGGSVISLIKRKDDWVDPPHTSNGHAKVEGKVRSAPREVVGEAHVSGWASSLLSNDEALDWMVEKRGLYSDTLKKYEIGWDQDRKVYTIPIRDAEGALINLRRYNPRPADDRRKIWQVAGMVSKALYPISSLNEARANGGRIIIGEGEWDILRTLQEGYFAITRTGAADVWLPQWGQLFEGLEVYVAHDADSKGEVANRKVAKSIAPYASSVRKIKLPFEQRDKNGEDLTDYWGKYDRDHFEALLASAPALKGKEIQETGPKTVSVLQSFDSKRVGTPVKMLVTIKGKREPGYTVPREATLSCDKSAGTKCTVCPMNETVAGEDTYDIKPDDPVVLELLDSTHVQVADIIRRAYGAQKCNRLQIEANGHQAVETLFARPSIDHVANESQAGDYKNVKITSVGRHDTLPNNTVAVIGALYPNPRSQTNEFQAWEIERQVTSVDKFDLTPEVIKQLKLFSTQARPLKKMAAISKELSQHVTRIYGRNEMHVLMDLVYHSVISFKFGGELVTRGWLEALVVGDTQQGKSETARSLSRHYQAGEVVNCEAASFAGIVGGLQQFGSGKEWAVTWGSIPLNDRRMVILEEASGLTPEQISQMSDIRSSGVAKLIKIQQEETYARTRLLWIGNPRDARMSEFTYGVDAIRPLIGTNEDIARFDIAMSVSLGEVAPEEMNKQHAVGELKYTSEVCAALVRWAWTRTAEQVVWAREAEQKVYDSALKLGALYVEDPPLVQASNIRLKIARIAVAMAARTFSTDEHYEKVIVKVEHVEDAVQFLNIIYGMAGFGYAERSREVLNDRQSAAENYDDVKQYLVGRKGLAKFLRSTGRFQPKDLESFMSLSREEANGVVNTLWNARMVRKERGEVVVEPMLHSILREVKL